MNKSLIVLFCLLLSIFCLSTAACDKAGNADDVTGTASAASSAQPTDPGTDPGSAADPAVATDTQPDLQTDAPTEAPTDAPTEAPTEPVTEPDPELPGEDDTARLHKVLDDHDDHMAHTTYSAHTEQTNRTVMTINGDVSESLETEVEEILHLADGTLYSAMTMTDDYNTYTEKTWYIDGVLYDDNSTDGRYKVRLSAQEYDDYSGGSYGTMDEIIDLLSAEDITIRWDKESDTFLINFAITDEDRLKTLMSNLMGDEADEVELSDMAFDGHLVVDDHGRILEDEVRLGYSVSYWGIIMSAETVSGESFVYDDSITITPPEDADSFAELSPEEFFGD